MNQTNNILIRNYIPADREAIRTIAYNTSFLGYPEKFVSNKEIIADALTTYFTDIEPESCFVAVAQEKVVGYVFGTKNVKLMDKIHLQKIWPSVGWKIISEGMLLKKNFIAFIFQILKSFLKGEFYAPRFNKDYPALLHINLDESFRKLGIGKQLIKKFCDYLQSHHIKAVHLGTMSEESKNFFQKQGFQVLYETKRTYLKYKLGYSSAYFLMGKALFLIPIA